MPLSEEIYIEKLEAENKRLRQALEDVQNRAAHTPSHKIFHTIAEKALLNVPKQGDGS